MDTKLKIIILVFTVIVVFYVFQFIFQMMQKKEHFSANYYDDVEGYEDAPNEKEKFEAKDEEYDLRISLLNEIDKLEITDNKVKGSVMESVFSEVSMKKMKSMSLEKRKEEVRNIYQAAVNQAGPVIMQETPVVINKPTNEQIKSMFENAPELPMMKDYFQNDARNKSMQAAEKLDAAIESLKEMKTILTSGTNEKEPYIPDLPVPPLPKEYYQKEEKEENPKTPLIEGFENIPSYASCF